MWINHLLFWLTLAWMLLLLGLAFVVVRALIRDMHRDAPLSSDPKPDRHDRPETPTPPAA